MYRTTASDARELAKRFDRANLGCGEDYRDGWLNIDVDEALEVDATVDLEEVPWPFDDDSFATVLLDNVFEHIDWRVREEFISELHRVTRPDGVIIMRLPVPEIGIGWQLDHAPIPHWRWPLNPHYRDNWEIENIAVTKTGFAKFIPTPLAILMTRTWLLRCISEVELRVQPVKEGEAL